MVRLVRSRKSSLTQWCSWVQPHRSPVSGNIIGHGLWAHAGQSSSMLVSKPCLPWTALCQLWKVPVIQIQEYSRETLDSSDGWFWLQSSRMALWKLPYTTQQRGHVCPAFLPSRLPRVTLHCEPVALPALLASSTCFLFFFFTLQYCSGFCLFSYRHFPNKNPCMFTHAWHLLLGEPGLTQETMSNFKKC